MPATFIAECVSGFFFKSVDIWQSYKQERGCLVHFARLANTLLKDEESDRLSNRPFLMWLLTIPPHLKYVATLPCNLSLIYRLFC